MKNITNLEKLKKINRGDLADEFIEKHGKDLFDDYVFIRFYIDLTEGKEEIFYNRFSSSQSWSVFEDDEVVEIGNIDLSSGYLEERDMQVYNEELEAWVEIEDSQEREDKENELLEEFKEILYDKILEMIDDAIERYQEYIECDSSDINMEWEV